MLGAFEQAVAVGIVADQILERHLHPRPKPLQERRVGRHLVLAINSQDVSRLAIHRGPDRLLGPVADDARFRVVADARRIIHLLAQDSFQLGEEPGDSMGIMPDVSARARATADPFPAVKSAVPEPVAGGCGQDRRIGERPVQEPVRQCRIIPGLMPEPGFPLEPGQFLADVPGNVGGRGEAGGIVSAQVGRQASTREREVGKMPDDGKLNAGFLPWIELHRPNQGAGELRAKRLLRRKFALED